MNIENIVKQNTDLIVQTIDDDIVILHLETGEYYGAHLVGNQIWQMIQQPLSIDNLIGQLVERFDGDRDTIQADVLEFLGELHKEGLILVEGE